MALAAKPDSMTPTCIFTNCAEQRSRGWRRQLVLFRKSRRSAAAAAVGRAASAASTGIGYAVEAGAATRTLIGQAQGASVSAQAAISLPQHTPISLSAAYEDGLFGQTFAGTVKQVRQGNDSPTDTYAPPLILTGPFNYI
jgi:hypothetical protein